MVADVSQRHRRSDVEEQVALVDTLNMLSQLYRDQVGLPHGTSHDACDSCVYHGPEAILCHIATPHCTIIQPIAWFWC